MKNIFKNESSQFIAFVAVVLLSRVPFLFSGFGLDPDSWEVALTAKHISETGTYEVSRLPGFPVHELLCSLFYNGSYVTLNILSTIISTIGFFFFALTLKALRFKNVFLASFALAAVPVVFINSTTTIDYNWALAFILVGFYFVVKDKPSIAGLFLGLAIGCRITSGAMLLPFAIMIPRADEMRNNFIRIAKLISTTLIVAALLFLPVLYHYGSGFFSYIDQPYPPIPKVLYKLTMDVWGTVGFAGLVIATCLLLLPNRASARKYLFPRSVNEKYVVAWLVAIDLYIIAFLKLPMESGYLIPIVPFVILVFGKYLYERAFVFFAITLIVSPFIASITPANRKETPSASSLTLNFRSGSEELQFDLLQGPVFSYESQRQNALTYANQVLQSADTVHKNTLLICGRWYTQLAILQNDTLKKSTRFVDYVSQEDLLKYIGLNYEICYLPQQDYFNLLKFGYNANLFGAVPFIKENR